MKKILLILCIIVCLFQSSLEAQIVSKRYNNWYMGWPNQNVHLNFSNDTVTASNDIQIGGGEDIATISDKYGRFLFGSDGRTVFNICGDTMLNGKGLDGNSSATDGALITPFIGPGEDSLYYLFSEVATCLACPGQLTYSIIDVYGDNCRGEVIFKNDTLLSPDGSEKLTATKHANGIDYWVITRSSVGKNFYSFLVSNTGINTVPVSSFLPASLSVDSGGYWGEMKASPDGSMLASGIVIGGLDGSFVPPLLGGFVELAYFNKTTGQVDSAKIISSFSYFPGIGAGFTSQDNVYGVEFSPDGKYLYASVGSNSILGGAGFGAVYRYDVTSPNPQATETLITNVDVGGMQLGPDGKIYTSGYGSGGNVSIFNTPNNINPGLVLGGIITPFPLGEGTPNTFYYYTNEDTSLTPPIDDLPYAGLLDSIFIDTCIGQTIQLGIPTEACREYAWTPSYGLDDSTIAQPTASKPNIYIVNVDYKCNYSDTVVLWTIDTLVTSTNNDTSICFGQTIPLLASGGLSYQWTPSSTLDFNNLDSVNATPLDTTTYSVIIGAGNCPSDTQYITIDVLFGDTTWLYPDTTICPGSIVDIYAISKGVSSGGSAIYLWTPTAGLDNPNILTPTFLSDTTLNDTTIRYTLTITGNGCGLLAKDYVDITILNRIINFDLPNDTIICENSPVHLFTNITGGNFIDWQPSLGLSDNSISNPLATVENTTTYIASASNQCDTSTASTTINTINCAIYIPNAFTPNGDGYNDIFKITAENPSSYLLKIYDRWGNKVFESKDINESWNGENNEKISNSGVYVYYLELNLPTGNNLVQNGNINLIK